MDSPAKFIDHTLLKADASNLEIAALCEEAVEHGFASVCVPPVFVAQVNRLLYGSDVAVCTVVGFPLGANTTAIKAMEARRALREGAREICLEQGADDFVTMPCESHELSEVLMRHLPRSTD